MTQYRNKNNSRKRPDQLNRENIRAYKYNNTSSAYDYAQKEIVLPEKPILSDYELQRRLYENKKKHFEKIKRKRAKQLHLKKIRQAKKINAINFFSICVLMIHLSCIMIFVLNLSDNNTEIKIEISQKQKIVDEQEKDISNRTIALTDSVDIHEIERVATEELGMKQPSSEQLVYVSLPKNRDYIEYGIGSEMGTNAKSYLINEQEIDNSISDSELVDEIIEKQETKTAIANETNEDVLNAEEDEIINNENTDINDSSNNSTSTEEVENDNLNINSSEEVE